MQDEIFVARVDFFYTDSTGNSRLVRHGSMFRAGHPVLAGRDELFEPIAEHVEPGAVGPEPKKTATPKLKLGGD